MEKVIDMRRILYFLWLGLAFVSTEINAQKTVVDEGLTYYTDKGEAFEAATLQGKMVFLFWGSVACPRCKKVKQNLASLTLRPILD